MKTSMEAMEALGVAVKRHVATAEGVKDIMEAVAELTLAFSSELQSHAMQSLKASLDAKLGVKK